MTNDRHVVITGFMGTGKTTVGRQIAALLSRPFLDTDAEIVRIRGMSIPDIFKHEGEQNFRHIERRMCRFLAAQHGLVIATGGGMLVDESNRNVMLASGLVVCLSASPETILRRLKDDPTERPLLQGDWQALMEKRAPDYAAIPNQVDTNNKTPEQIAQEIVTLWQQQTASV